MSRRRHLMKVAGALLLGFGVGTWFGSERTLRRIRFYSDPANRTRIEDAKRRYRARRKSFETPGN